MSLNPQLLGAVGLTGIPGSVLPVPMAGGGPHPQMLPQQQPLMMPGAPAKLPTIQLQGGLPFGASAGGPGQVLLPGGPYSAPAAPSHQGVGPRFIFDPQTGGMLPLGPMQPTAYSAPPMLQQAAAQNQIMYGGAGAQPQPFDMQQMPGAAAAGPSAMSAPAGLQYLPMMQQTQQGMLGGYPMQLQPQVGRADLSLPRRCCCCCRGAAETGRCRGAAETVSSPFPGAESVPAADRR